MRALGLLELAKRHPNSNDTVPLKPQVDPSTLTHRQLLEVPPFRQIPAYRDVTDEEFFDHRWQAKRSITRPDKLLETLRDVALRPLPLAPGDAQAMVRELRAFAILDGARGRPPVDLDAIAGTLNVLADFAVRAGESLASAEINPRA